MPNRLKGLGLDDTWVVKFAGTADALWAELEAAKKEGRGTVVFNWTPNFTDAEGFSFIEFPPYYDGCRIADVGDLSTTGCGSPVGWLRKAAHYKLPKTHPQAYTIFSKISFTTPQIGSMAALVDPVVQGEELLGPAGVQGCDHRNRRGGDPEPSPGPWESSMPTMRSSGACIPPT